MGSSQGSVFETTAPAFEEARKALNRRKLNVPAALSGCGGSIPCRQFQKILDTRRADDSARNTMPSILSMKNTNLESFHKGSKLGTDIGNAMP